MAHDLTTLDELTSWDRYRGFMKERLKQIPEGDCPIFVSKEKVEFDDGGNRWRGSAVLLGPKGEQAAKALRKEGVQFREGTCRQQGKSFEVQGVPANAVQSAELTLQRLRLGFSLVGGSGGETESATASLEAGTGVEQATELNLRRQELVADIKDAAALKEPANADVLKRAALKARDVESALGQRGLDQAEKLLDEIEELMTEVVEGPELAGDEDPDLAGLGDWKAYRRFMQAQLKRLPPKGGPFFVSRKKLEFSIRGKPFEGLAVLVGAKARITMLALKKEGATFAEGTCVGEGKKLQVSGISLPLFKGARKTFLKLRMGRKLSPLGELQAEEASETDASSGEAAGSAAKESPAGETRPFEIGASVGRGGKNLEDDVRAVQLALNRRLGAGLSVDGICTQATIAAIVEFQKALGQFKPDGRVVPRRGVARALALTGRIGPPPAPPKAMAPPKLEAPSLAKAPAVWHGTRHFLDTNIKELKKAISLEYANEHPDLIAEIDENVKKVDGILGKLDQRLAHALDRANGATDPAKRSAELQNAKAILAEYIRYVKSEPLVGHIDANPFGVDTKLRHVLTESLTHMAKSIG